MKWKIASWICFAVGVLLIVIPIDSKNELINRYHLDGGEAELAAKFYLRGFVDKMEWSLIAMGFFLIAMLLMMWANKKKT